MISSVMHALVFTLFFIPSGWSPQPTLKATGSPEVLEIKILSSISNRGKSSTARKQHTQLRQTVRPANLSASPAGDIHLPDPFQLDLIRKINEALDYPLNLRARRIEGTAQIKIILSKTGHLESTQIIQSSGHRELDQLALNAVTAAQPYPPPPDSLSTQNRNLTINLPVQFRLTQ